MAKVSQTVTKTTRTTKTVKGNANMPKSTPNHGTPTTDCCVHQKHYKPKGR